MRARRGERRLRALVLGLIEERRRSRRDHGDMLSMLMLAEGEGGGDGMTVEQVWQEALTIFIGGFDTIATALMWTFYALSQNPQVEARLHEELDSVLEGGRAAAFENLRRLQYTERVLCESMRLYPPTWRLMRRALRDFPLGDYVIPSGSLVVVCQYAMHRDPRFFPDPETFDPERWTPEARTARPSYSFFPFGGGPRRCLGEQFAMTEGVLLLATLARRLRMRLVEGHRVELLPQHLLRSKWGMRMRLEDQLVAARRVYAHAAQHAREARRRVHRKIPVVADVYGGRVGEAQQRRRCLVGVLPVYYVGRGVESVEVFDDGHCLPANQLGERPRPGAVEHGRVARGEQPARKLHGVHLRPRALAQRVVRDENFKTIHRGTRRAGLSNRGARRFLLILHAA